MILLFLILQEQHLAQTILPLRHGGYFFFGVNGRSLRIEEHTCAEAASAIVALQDIVVLTTLATLPELIILRELGECYGNVA